MDRLTCVDCGSKLNIRAASMGTKRCKRCAQVEIWTRADLHSKRVERLRATSNTPENKAKRTKAGYASWDTPELRGKHIAALKARRGFKGQVKSPSGYLMVRADGHPHAKGNGYVLYHRIVMEQSIGRFLKPSEVVHHRDGNRENNSIENLALLSGHAEHRKIHARGL